MEDEPFDAVTKQPQIASFGGEQPIVELLGGVLPH
jgi:hypothetical protein